MLGGSAKHLIGHKGENEPPTSDLPSLLNALAAPRSISLEGVSDLASPNDSDALYAFSNAVSFCLGRWGGTQERLSVLALRLKFTTGIEFEGHAWQVTIGTPLFVYRANGS